MADPPVIFAKSRRGRDVVVNYTTDKGFVVRFSQRIYKDPLSDRLLTPFTDTFLQATFGAIPLLTLEPKTTRRRVFVEYDIPANLGGTGTYQIVVPFNPADPRWKQQLAEIVQYKTEGTVSQSQPKHIIYYGESKQK